MTATPDHHRRVVDLVDEHRIGLVDPVRLFDRLLREVDAGRALIGLSDGPAERRRAALDALQLARDVLDDARDQLRQLARVEQLEPAVTPVDFTGGRTSCACGSVDLVDVEDVRPDAVDDDLVHSSVACTRED